MRYLIPIGILILFSINGYTKRVRVQREPFKKYQAVVYRDINTNLLILTQSCFEAYNAPENATLIYNKRGKFNSGKLVFDSKRVCDVLDVLM